MFEFYGSVLVATGRPSRLHATPCHEISDELDIASMRMKIFTTYKICALILLTFAFI